MPRRCNQIHRRLLCATRGELGTDDPDLIGTERFARTRESELESSLAVLGVGDVRFLGLRDGACADADASRMVGAIADEIDEFRPDAVVTFGPDGITGHPDHRAVSRWTTAAASSVATELLYAAVTHQHAARHRHVHDSIGLFSGLEGGRAASIPTHRVALRCALDHGELIRKRRALSCHGSQTDGLAATIGEDLYFEWWRDECFRHPTPTEAAAARAATRATRVLAGAGT